jgi:hypothetical protein
MAQAPPVGQSVVNEVFAFLQTRALIATKWHRLDLARHAVVLGNMTELQRQQPHTDFEIVKFEDFSPEIENAQSFSIMVVLQRTTVYFRDVAGVMVPEVMEAGDVLVFRGDAVHCGAEWTESDQIAAMSKLKPTQRFLPSLVSLRPFKKNGQGVHGHGSRTSRLRTQYVSGAYEVYGQSVHVRSSGILRRHRDISSQEDEQICG